MAIREKIGPNMGLSAVQSPPKGTHRYVFLLYKQTGRISAKNPHARQNFTLHQFAQVGEALHLLNNVLSAQHHGPILSRVRLSTCDKMLPATGAPDGRPCSSCVLLQLP